MKNYVQDGNVIDWVATADTVSGAVVVVGSLVGVALTDIKSGETGSLLIEGVVELKKLSSAVIAQGKAVIFDISPTPQVIVASAATGDILSFGVAVKAAGNGDLTVWVKLSPGVGTVSP